MNPAASIIIPVYNEGDAIVACLDRLLASVESSVEVLVVYDTPEDTTAPHVRAYSEHDPKVRGLLNTYGRGPARAIRFGIDAAAAPVAVVSMADGSDDVTQVDVMIRLVNEGAVIVSPSRYMRGGRQHGGPALKKLLSTVAGRSLFHLARVGTHDSTNSFKAYDVGFVRGVGIESSRGFEMGIELVAKARRLRRAVVEFPTTWEDRTVGDSNFRVWSWIPSYLRWYFFSFGRALSVEQIKSRQAKVAS